MKIGIKIKLLLLVIPLLLSCFAISTTYSVLMSRKNLVLQSTEFMQYQLDQMAAFTAGQWGRLIASGFSRDEYYQVIKDSIVSYARETVRGRSQIIITFDPYGTVIFCTDEEESCKDGDFNFDYMNPYLNSSLEEIELNGVRYLGLSRTVKGIEWEIILLQEKEVFIRDLRELTTSQFLTFSLTFIVIIAGLILILNMIINPINSIKDTIRQIIGDQNFSHTVPVNYPDEIGDLALNFNDMISNLDMAHRKMKDYAVDEAISRKKAYLRELETLEVLGRASDFKDTDTGSHVRRVAGYSRIIAESIGIGSALGDLLFYASPLHDMGKLGIPDAVLLKKDRLNDEEIRKMKEHTNLGYDILKDFSSKYLKAGAVIALSHHEKFDGSGYPRGLSGEEIPLFGRIVSIADVFDALTTKRPYKEAWPLEKAFDLIEREKGKHFDPDLAAAFLKNKDKITEIYEKLN